MTMPPQGDHQPQHAEHAYGGPTSPPAGAPAPGAPAPQPYSTAPAPGSPTYVGASPSRRSSSRTLGWVGVAVLYALVLWQLAVPTVRTLLMSMRESSFDGSGAPVGLTHWEAVAPQAVPGALMMMAAVLPATVVAAALGLVIAGGMTAQHRLAVPVRVVVGVLGALFVPIGTAALRYVDAGYELSLTGLSTTFTLAALPLLTALFATAFAPVLSAPAPGRGVAVVLVVGLAGALALGPQLFELVYLTPTSEGTLPPMLLVQRLGFAWMDVGPAAAVASMMLLGAGLLGVVAMLALLLTRTRLAPAVEPPAAPARSGPAGLVVAAIVLVLGLLLVGPFLLAGLTDVGAVAPDIRPTELAVRTWLPAALGTLLQVGVAVLGGAAIGLCRPAGSRSLWLLLPLAPWLFVGPGPLVLVDFVDASEAGLLGTWWGTVPRPVVVVAAVVVLALLLDRAAQQPGPRARAQVATATAGIGALLLLVQGQSLLPGLITGMGAEPGAPVTVLLRLGQYGLRLGEVEPLLGLLLPIPVFLLVAALGVLAQLGTRGLAVTTGDAVAAGPAAVTPYPGQDPLPLR